MNKRKYQFDIMTSERILKHKMKIFHHLFERVLQNSLSESGIFAGESRILMIIADNEVLSQKDIAKSMGTSRTSVGVTLKKLENKGYIIKKIDDADSRINLIKLTTKGEDFIEDAHKIFQNLDKQTFNGLSKDEMELFDGFMTKINDNLNNLLEK